MQQPQITREESGLRALSGRINRIRGAAEQRLAAAAEANKSSLQSYVGVPTETQRIQNATSQLGTTGQQQIAAATPMLPQYQQNSALAASLGYEPGVGVDPALSREHNKTQDFYSAPGGANLSSRFASGGPLGPNSDYVQSGGIPWYERERQAANDAVWRQSSASGGAWAQRNAEAAAAVRDHLSQNRSLSNYSGPIAITMPDGTSRVASKIAAYEHFGMADEAKNLQDAYDRIRAERESSPLSQMAAIRRMEKRGTPTAKGLAAMQSVGVQPFAQAKEETIPTEFGDVTRTVQPKPEDVTKGGLSRSALQEAMAALGGRQGSAGSPQRQGSGLTVTGQAQPQQRAAAANSIADLTGESGRQLSGQKARSAAVIQSLGLSSSSTPLDIVDSIRSGTTADSIKSASDDEINSTVAAIREFMDSMRNIDVQAWDSGMEDASGNAGIKQLGDHFASVPQSGDSAAAKRMWLLGFHSQLKNAQQAWGDKAGGVGGGAFMGRGY